MVGFLSFFGSFHIHFRRYIMEKHRIEEGDRKKMYTDDEQIIATTTILFNKIKTIQTE
jgi:hypothetical protein